MFVSANHSSTGGNHDPMHNSITAWVEVRQRTSIILIPIVISRNSSLKYYFVVNLLEIGVLLFLVMTHFSVVSFFFLKIYKNIKRIISKLK